MIKIDNKKLCCGCSACENICPNQCITMREDFEGFIYPKINTGNCINCGLCNKVCPMTKAFDDTIVPKTVVARDVRKDVLCNGTSGSIFTSIMEYILGKDGVIYGVIVDEKLVVRHIRVDSLDDMNYKKIPNSKYCRSDIRGIYTQVRNDLNKKKIVCFSGTPCQVAGLKSFLSRDYDNLFLIDVVCHGNPSPLFWKCFVQYLEKKHNSHIQTVRFRNKTYGYHSGTMKVEFENNKKLYQSARTNYYLKAFFSDLVSRPSCYDCHFKHIQHNSDLTLYDSWHASELANIRDDNQGYTNVIIQTEKGRMLLEMLHTVEKYPVNTLDAINLDGIMVKNSVLWNEKRESFFVGLTSDNFKEHCDRYLRIDLKDKMIESLKKYYYRIKKGKRRYEE